MSLSYRCAAMDREEIERRDFPVGRRGYDQGAIHVHLRRVADEMERVREQADAPARAPLSAGTSEQVRKILEAAERSAADLRHDAGRDAGDHVGRVGEATDGMLERLDELQAELGTLIDALRASGQRLADGLGELQERVADVHPPAAPVPEVEAAAVVPPPVEDEDFATPAEEDVDTAAEEDFAAAAEPDAGADDEAAARITALNMALSGTPRGETAAYVAEHYRLADAEALLDDVYAKAGR